MRRTGRLKRTQNLTAEIIEIVNTIAGKKTPPVALVTVTGTSFGDTQSTGQSPTPSVTANRSLVVNDGSTNAFDLSPSSEFSAFVMEGKFVRGTRRGTFRINGWHDGAAFIGTVEAVSGDDPGFTGTPVSGVIVGGTLTVAIAVDSSGNNLELTFAVRPY